MSQKGTPRVPTKTAVQRAASRQFSLPIQLQRASLKYRCFNRSTHYQGDDEALKVLALYYCARSIHFPLYSVNPIEYAWNVDVHQKF
jgi:hypothetical protein